jgi:bifunctional ADP-heptose synthase (sugar kinase/adenylyltransferase)
MSLASALALIESVKNDRVLFIGETIIDEYRFVAPLAKPPKENVLAVRLLETERYEGGVDAARAHADSFCRAVQVYFGNKIRKSRYLDAERRKLFEVQELDETQCTESNPPLSELADCIYAITDFGHGALSPAIIAELCASPRFLAVACQTNAANHGFNLITKYPRADYIVIDEPEARLAAHDRASPIEDVMRALAADRCDKMIVTHGRHGAYGLHQGVFTHAPALSRNVVDTLGAGDAFFAITAPMARSGSMEDLLLIGNAAGALKCGILGHRESVTKTALVEFLMRL